MSSCIGDHFNQPQFNNSPFGLRTLYTFASPESNQLIKNRRTSKTGKGDRCGKRFECIGTCTSTEKQSNEWRPSVQKDLFEQATLGAGVGQLIGLAQTFDGDMGIDLSGRETGVPQHLLNAAQIGTGIQEMGGKAVPQLMGCQL